MRHRIQYIDRLKGFAILAVIFGHLCMWQLGGYDSPTWFVGTFHMPVFLFLSGIVTTPPNIRKCIRKILQFLLPGIIVGGIYSYYIDSNIIRFFLHDSKLGYWYLFVLSGYYMLMLLFHYINTFDGRKGFLVDCALAVLLFVGLAGLHFLLGKKVSDLFCVYKMCMDWPAFFLGYMTKKYSKIREFLYSNHGYTVTILAYTICLMLDYHQLWYYMWVPMGLFAAVFFANLFQRREQQSSPVESELARLGRGSLDIYIYHFFFLWMINLRPVGTWLFETNNLLLFVSVSVVLSVIIAYLCLLIGYVLKTSTLLQTVIYGKRN